MKVRYRNIANPVGPLRGSIGVSPSNEYASRRGYLQGLSFIWEGVNSVTMPPKLPAVQYLILVQYIYMYMYMYLRHKYYRGQSHTPSQLGNKDSV